MRIVGAVIFLTYAGCARDDGDKLAAVGRVVVEKVRTAAPAKNPVADLALDATPTSRVKARIRTDVFLVNQPIEIGEFETVIYLRGKVPSREHSERAEQLAKETVGVTKVVNELAIGP